MEYALHKFLLPFPELIGLNFGADNSNSSRLRWCYIRPNGFYWIGTHLIWLSLSSSTLKFATADYLGLIHLYEKLKIALTQMRIWLHRIGLEWNSVNMAGWFQSSPGSFVVKAVEGNRFNGAGFFMGFSMNRNHLQSVSCWALLVVFAFKFISLVIRSVISDKQIHQYDGGACMKGHILNWKHILHWAALIWMIRQRILYALANQTDKSSLHRMINNTNISTRLLQCRTVEHQRPNP